MKQPAKKVAYDVSALAVALVAITLLQPFAKNPRDHGKAHVDEIVRSIRQFGMIVPILCDELFVIIAGHATLLACKVLGLAQVPVIQLFHLTEAEKIAFRIAHNRLAEKGKWDAGLLAANFDMLMSQDLSFDLELSGFAMAEIDIARIGGAEAVKSNAIEAANREELVAMPDPLSVPISRLGDRFSIGEYIIVCGDARDSSAYHLALADQRCDVAICDPPYNTPIFGNVSGLGKKKHEDFILGSGEMDPLTFQQFISDSARLQAAFSKPGAYNCMFTGWYSMSDMLIACATAYLKLAHICVWKKTNGGMGSLWRNSWEGILVYQSKKGKTRNNVMLGKYGRNRTDVFEYAGVNTFRPGRMEELVSHPTCKPVPLLVDLILDITPIGGVVLDVYLGSGSTILAAHDTKRRGVGIELDPKYVDVAIERVQKHIGKEAIHQNGMTFAQLGVDRRANERDL